MREIPLSRKKGAGLVALIDDEDFHRVSKYKWHPIPGKKTIYASSSFKQYNGKYIAVYLHRFILGITEQKIQCDHKDHNGLNCQRSNLRACSRTQNHQNRSHVIGCSSAFKGVTWHCRIKKWSARITNNGNRISLGCFDDQVSAAHAYDKAAREFFGEFAYLNFPE